MLSELKHAKTNEDIISIVTQKYFDLIDGEYIPAILEEGRIYSSTGSHEDFYAKLIIVPLENDDTMIDDTWLKSNLTINSPNASDLEDKPKAYNVIVYRNYKRKSLYQINPAFLSDDYLVEYDQKDDTFASQYLVKENHNRINDIPVFKAGTSPVSLYINMLTLDWYISLPNQKSYYTPEFELFLEFEYRSKNASSIPDFKGLAGKAFLDISNISSHEVQIAIRGTIPLNIKDIKINESDGFISRIKVFGLDNGTLRDLNPSNTNDDMEAGFVVFKNDALSILREEYYFYDLCIIPKNDLDKSSLIDTFAEYFVFWEGEFNKLPMEIKNSLISYNIVERPEQIISPVMFKWQLEGSWHYMDSATPRTKLANYVKNNNFNVAIENGADFCIPFSDDEMKKFLDVIDALYGISPYNYNQESDDIKILCSIKDGCLNNELSPHQYLTLFEKYCNAVLKKVSADE